MTEGLALWFVASIIATILILCAVKRGAEADRQHSPDEHAEWLRIGANHHGEGI